MNTAELRELPIDQKIRIMETLWDDFRERFERRDIPQRHKDLLDQRRERAKNGEAEIHDWDSVKGTIGRA